MVQQPLRSCDRSRAAQQLFGRRGQARQAAGIGSDDLKGGGPGMALIMATWVVQPVSLAPCMRAASFTGDRL